MQASFLDEIWVKQQLAQPVLHELPQCFSNSLKLPGLKNPEWSISHYSLLCSSFLKLKVENRSELTVWNQTLKQKKCNYCYRNSHISWVYLCTVWQSKEGNSKRVKKKKNPLFFFRGHTFNHVNPIPTIYMQMDRFSIQGSLSQPYLEHIKGRCKHKVHYWRCWQA